jgi:2-oxoglutarate dehydrogenase E2 component (dihydrolipoamide succinyltransferase)
MPQLGESVTEGTVTRWLKKEGEHVTADEPLLEVSTDKVDTEIPSPATGILRGIAVDEDETVAVGAQLAVIEDSESAGVPEPADTPAAPEPAVAESTTAGPAPSYVPPAEPVPAATEPAAVNGESGSSTWSWNEPPAAPPVPAYAPPPVPEPAAYLPPTPAYAPPTSYASSASFEAEPEDSYPSPLLLPTGDSPYVTPLVRKLAAEHSVPLEAITGTGVGGRIRKQDVLEAARAQRARDAAAAQAAAEAAAAEAAAAAAAAAAPSTTPVVTAAAVETSAAAEAAPAAPAAPSRPVLVPSALRGTTQRMSRPRQVIAKRMVESLQTSAQLTTVVEADVTNIARLRERAKAAFEAREGVKLTFLPFFAQATVEALKIHPKLNAVINAETQEVTYHDAEHLGIAVDTERGLMVPVVHQAGDLNIGGLARKIADVAARTRSGQVGPDELSGGTFTLTNTGSRGALFDTPIINLPQVGILGVGSVVKRAVVVDDPALGEVIAVRSMVYLALTYDHRLVDGADAARFLVTVKSRLEEGAFEAELGL